MHIRPKLFLLFIFLLAVMRGFAQQPMPVFINFTTQDGLASNETHRVVQDAEGYIWIATDFGLSRYDGYSFRNYGVADGLPESSILSLYMDQEGKIWFTTFASYIGYLEKDKIHTIPMNSELRKQLSSSFISSFYTVDGDTIYYSAHNISGYFKITANRVVHVQPPNMNSVVSCVFERKDEDHIFHYRAIPPNQSGETARLYFNSTDSFVQASGPCKVIRTLAHGDMSYYAVEKTLYRQNGKNEVESREESNVVICARILNGKFYLGKQKAGLEIYDDDPFSDMALKCLDDLSVTDVVVDREGGLWVTTLERGVYYLPNPNIFEVKFNTLSREKTVTSMVAAHGRIYFGTLNGQIYEWDKVTCAALPVEGATNNESVLSLAYDERYQTLIAGTHQKAIAVKDNKIVMSDPFAAAMFLRKDENGKIWGGNSDYIFYFEYDKIKPERLVSAQGLRFFDLLPLEGNKMLGATIEGLYHYYPDDTLYKVHKQDTLNTIRFTCLEKINGKIIVAGTRGQGIVVLTGEKFFFINTGNNLPDNCIQDILVEGTVMYAATNDGISKINFDLADPGKYHITNYSTAEGYHLNKVTSIARFGEKIYAGTEDGLFYFDPDKSNYIDIPPAIVMNGIIINNRPTEVDTGYDLKYNENNISVKFTGISPRSLGHITYLYRMLPDDTRWRSTPLREINFSSLTPGRYTFECLAQNAAGISSAAPLRLHFLIHEPLWKTWWFKWLISLMVILAGYYIFRDWFRRKYMLQQHELERVKMIEEERHRIAADMHDDLGTDLTELVLTTRRLAHRKDTTNADLEKVGSAASDLIDKLSQIIWAMNPAYDYLPNLTTYITRFIARQCELNELHFHLDQPEEIPNLRVGASLRRNIFLILKEALNNAIRHGHPTEVKLKIRFTDDMLIISLLDNGKGFVPAERMNAGNGMSNLQKRASLIGAELSIVSSPSNGAEVIVSLKTESAG